MTSSIFNNFDFDSAAKKISKNQLTSFQRIQLHISRNPNDTAKVALKVLKLPYKRYAATYSSEKFKFRKYLGFGQAHKALDHRLVLKGVLSGDLFAEVGEVAGECRPAAGVRPVGKWYVSPNRNKMLCFRDKSRCSLKVHQNGRVIVEGRIRDFKEIGDAVFEAFYVGARFSYEKAVAVIETLKPESRHRVIYVGKKLPAFKTDFYKRSLGLTILADESHPGYLETFEDWPQWAVIQKKTIEQHIKIDVDQRHQDREVVHEFATEFRSHVGAMKGIGEAGEKLNETIDRLDKTMRDNGEACPSRNGVHLSVPDISVDPDSFNAKNKRREFAPDVTIWPGN